jgi:hypothetical protein
MIKKLKSAIYNRIYIYLFKNIYIIIDFLYIEIFDLLNNYKYHNNEKEFTKNGYMKFNLCDSSFFAKLLTESICLETQGVVVRESDCLSPSDFTRKIDLFFKNISFSEVSGSLLNEYTFIRDPISSIAFLERFIIRDVIPFAENLMGGGVSIENVQIYKTSPSITLLTNENLHVDGDIGRSFKLMFYLTDCGLEDGPLEVHGSSDKFIWTGVTGDGLAFRAASVPHRGHRPINSVRWVLNLKVYPKLGRSNIEYSGSKYLNATRRKVLFMHMR